MTTPGAQGVAGQQGITDNGSDHNVHTFNIDQQIGRMATAMPVKIIAVHGGGLGSAPTVDVQPMVKMTDGTGVATSHGTIYGIQTHRSQGGQNVVINDPVVGDVGHIVVPHRDISSVKATGRESTPGSFRRHDMADGIYHGSLGLAGQETPSTPNQYIHFTETGMVLQDKNGNTIEMKPGSIAITGNLTVTGEITAGFGGGDFVKVQTHIHSGVVPGGGDTAAPVPGT